MGKEIFTGTVGTGLMSASAIMSSDEILTIISMCLSILGAILTFIVIPIIKWISESKKDGKITMDEVNDLVNELKNGIEQTNAKVEELKNGFIQTDKDGD